MDIIFSLCLWNGNISIPQNYPFHSPIGPHPFTHIHSMRWFSIAFLILTINSTFYLRENPCHDHVNAKSRSLVQSLCPACCPGLWVQYYPTWGPTNYSGGKKVMYLECTMHLRVRELTTENVCINTYIYMALYFHRSKALTISSPFVDQLWYLNIWAAVLRGSRKAQHMLY